jgi:hypothetical protein
MTISTPQFDFAPRLFQKLVGFTTQPLGNANQTGQRKIVFAAFDTADICPVHVRAFGERFLRQSHFFPIRAHVLCHTLAILIFHARQVWKKKAPSNIDVNTIVFNTRHPPRTLAKLGLLIPVESLKLRPGASQARPDSGLQVFPKCHREKSGRDRESCRKILWSDESGESSQSCGVKRGATSKRLIL